MARIFSHRYLLTPNVIPYGIDGMFFASGTKARHNNFTIMQAAMVSPSKNQLNVLEAAKQLRSLIPNIHVVFAGYMESDNVYTHILQDYIKKHGLNVTFTGLISREYLRELYYSTDVAVFPGRGQGSWLGPFEAIAASVPVIVSPKLSCSSLIARENLGIVTEDFVANIKRVYDNKSETEKAKQYVLQNLTWNKFCGEFAKLL
jgi:glycosyltransferase involved in cell wall biosynthesis